MVETRGLLPVAAVVGVSLLACAWWLARAHQADPSATQAAEREAATLASPGETLQATAPRPAPTEDASRALATAASDAAVATPSARVAPDGPTPSTWSDVVRWPAAHASRSPGAAVSVAEPDVPTRLAFRALWYLGVDPDAEKTWSRAINDPKQPEGVRSDLIADMVDEGYSDNSHPTKADLLIILARLEIIERYAPYAMDQVNAAAFERTYRSLLEMYTRLGGEPRGRR